MDESNEIPEAPANAATADDSAEVRARNSQHCCLIVLLMQLFSSV